MPLYRFPMRMQMSFRWLSTLLVLTLLLSACTVNVYVSDPDSEIAQIVVGEEAAAETSPEQSDGDHDGHEDHDHEASGPGGRLLVADSETGLLQVINLGDSALIAEYELAGPASLYTTESGRLAGVVQWDANVVNFVDSGVWVEDHGDHVHNNLADPVLLPFTLDGSNLGSVQPVHFVSHHGWVTVHFDGNSDSGFDAKNVLVREADLLTETPALLEFVTAPQHGVSVMAHDGRIVLSDPAAEVGALPSGFVVYAEAGTPLQTFHDLEDPSASCIGMHGEGVVGNRYLFGCHQDDGGVLVLTQDEPTGEFTSSKITYPDNRRTSVLATSEHQPFAVGQYGAYPEYNGLVRIDPTLAAIPAEAITDLPANQCGFAFERSQGEQVVVLTEDGYVRVFDPLTWPELSNLQISDPFACFGEEAVPALAVGENVAYVSLPAAGEVVEITLPTATIARSFAVSGTPGSVAVFGWWQPLRGGSGADDHAAHEPTAAPEAQGDAATLVVADVNEGGLYAYSIPDWQPVAEFPDLMLADHPGYLVLPDGRVLFTTHDQEFVVLALDGEESQVVARVPLPGGSIHFAVHPSLSFAVVSTMRDEAAGVGENTLTQIDLTTYTASSIPVTSGEPGVLVSDEAVLHRDGGEIGRLEAFPLANFANNDGTAASYMDIGSYGHGEGLVNNHAYVATDDGIDVVRVDGTELTHVALIPWNVSGREGGRGYYMRADAHGNLWSYLRIVQNPAQDASWDNWQDWGNDGYLINTATNEASRFDLGPGLVYRMSLSQAYALYSRLHPDGDQAILVDADPASATFAEIVATINLPATSDAPVEGVAPWDAAGQRITAISPDGKWGFVSGGGDGVVHVIDTEAQAIVGQIETPAPLMWGGYLLVVQPGQAVVDSLGR